MTRFTICDDEPEHCELISRYIKAEYEERMQGTDIAETNVYQSSADMLAEAVEDTDIFILDIECGDVSGLEVAKRIHEQKKMLNVSGGRLINIDNIVAVEVYTHALIFRGTDTDMEIRSTLSEYENILKQYGFIKISRSIKQMKQ